MTVMRDFLYVIGCEKRINKKKSNSKALAAAAAAISSVGKLSLRLQVLYSTTRNSKLRRAMIAYVLRVHGIKKILIWMVFHELSISQRVIIQLLFQQQVTRTVFEQLFSDSPRTNNWCTPGLYLATQLQKPSENYQGDKSIPSDKYISGSPFWTAW